MRKLLKFNESVDGSIETRVINAVKRCLGDKEINLSTTFEYLGLIEIDLVEIFIFLEEEFDFNLDDYPVLDKEIDGIFKDKAYLKLDVSFLVKIIMDLK